MDVQKFRNSREAELADFKKQYNFLKTEYSSVLSSAVQEKDPASQQELIQQVLQLNSSMAEELRSIIAKLNQGSPGFDPKELDELTKDLIQYQKDYEEIEKSKDKVNTLKMIRESNEKKLGTAMTMYNVYIAILIGLSFLVAYLVFRTEWGRRVVSTVSTVLPQ
jgi:DNA repair exonuclease SbcCD ATPase subunit